MPDRRRLEDTIAVLEREQHRIAAQLDTLRHLVVRLAAQAADATPAQNRRTFWPIT